MKRHLIAPLTRPFGLLTGDAGALERPPRGVPDLRCLTPVLELVPAAPPPPGLLALIEQRINAQRPPSRMPWLHLAGIWLAGAAAGAAAMAAVVMLAPMRGPELVLPLSIAEGADRVAMLSARTVGDGRYLRIDHFGLRPSAGRALELWILREGSGKPESLGLLAVASGMTVLAIGQKIIGGDVLAISEEPMGGAPGSGPSGPVVVTARIGAEI